MTHDATVHLVAVRATASSIVLRDLHAHGRRQRLAPAPALQTLELIDRAVHVALDCGLVALDAFELWALGNTQPLPGDLKIGSFLFTKSSNAWLISVSESLGDHRAALKRIKAPTVVIHGADDPLVPVEAGRYTAANIAGAEMIEIPGMGHDLPAALYSGIVDAIESVAKRACPRQGRRNGRRLKKAHRRKEALCLRSSSVAQSTI